MAHKTFISYKHSEAQELRDKIIEKLGADARYYNGETSESPDRSDNTTESIKNYLKDMIFDATVTIVIISPNMKQSNWIDWEIEYSLREYKRNVVSSTNGIVGVVMKYNGGYEWLKSSSTEQDGHVVNYIKHGYLYSIISNNMFNQNPRMYSCLECNSFDPLTGSYISLINEDDFLANPSFYIENAYEKSKQTDSYVLVKDKNFK